jgi:hypothetical protein
MTAEPHSDVPRSALASLRRYLRPEPVRERCDLCSAVLPADHAHLVEPAARRLLCACEACAILFSGQAAMKYRRVPRDVQLLADFHLDDVLWEGLQLPINLAFFLHSTPAGRVVAFYPSPAGATEALPPEDVWRVLVEDNPVLRELEPDVEALLVNRLGESHAYFRAPIDECYQLVGLIRKNWHGLSGGSEVGDTITHFFADLKARAHATGGRAHA